MQVRSHRRYGFDIGPQELWSLFSQVERYQSWWPWLRRFEAASLSPGERWSCLVQPPLPYVVRFDLVLEDVVAGRCATARVEGDITGRARIDVAPTDDGAELHLVSHLAPASRFLRAMAGVARPVVHFGHDWVLDTGFRQFTARAVDGGAGHPPPPPLL